jgi:hypothetical protein
MLGYFTEGTYYTQRAEGASTTLLLQAGGARFQWLDDPGELGIGSERQREIDAGQWRVPEHLR